MDALEECRPTKGLGTVLGLKLTSIYVTTMSPNSRNRSSPSPNLNFPTHLIKANPRINKKKHQPISQMETNGNNSTLIGKNLGFRLIRKLKICFAYSSFVDLRVHCSEYKWKQLTSNRQKLRYGGLGFRVRRVLGFLGFRVHRV